MEERKETEISYYDQKAQQLMQGANQKGDFEGFDPFLLSSYQFLQSYLKDKLAGKKVLDFGCGNGVHSFWLAEAGAEVIGIDLSQKSLELARERAKKQTKGIGPQFLVMDCEKLEFADNSFDIIFDGGTFSSLDLQKVFPELARVLRPGGFVVGIETLGHNPLINAKRKLNTLVGKRTGWAASHIVQMQDFENAKQYFSSVKVYFFHVTGWVTFPFLKIPGFTLVLAGFETLDKMLEKIPFLRRYSFKAVFIFSK